MCEGSSEVPEQKVELAGEDGVFHLALSSLTVLKKRRGTQRRTSVWIN